MFEWLFLFFFPTVPSHAEPPKKDFVGVVAAEAAYTAMLPGKKEVTPDRPIDPNCPTCRGTGKVKSGDGISWTKCPTCQAAMQKPSSQQPSMRLQVKPLPAPKTSSCPTGNCPYPRG
jgi:hypothetical protein